MRVVTLAVALVVAGVLHLALSPEHMGESQLLGWGFVAAAVAQISLGLMSLRPARVPVRGIMVLNVVLIALYAMHVTIGLPLPDAVESDEAVRGLLGPREAIEAPAIATKVIELAGIALALVAPRTTVATKEEERVSRAA